MIESIDMSSLHNASYPTSLRTGRDSVGLNPSTCRGGGGGLRTFSVISIGIPSPIVPPLHSFSSQFCFLSLKLARYLLLSTYISSNPGGLRGITPIFSTMLCDLGSSRAVERNKRNRKRLTGKACVELLRFSLISSFFHVEGSPERGQSHRSRGESSPMDLGWWISTGEERA